jgi:hypothetical protein
MKAEPKAYNKEPIACPYNSKITCWVAECDPECRHFKKDNLQRIFKPGAEVEDTLEPEETMTWQERAELYKADLDKTAEKAFKLVDRVKELEIENKAAWLQQSAAATAENHWRQKYIDLLNALPEDVKKRIEL